MPLDSTKIRFTSCSVLLVSLSIPALAQVKMSHVAIHAAPVVRIVRPHVAIVRHPVMHREAVVQVRRRHIPSVKMPIARRPRIVPLHGTTFVAVTAHVVEPVRGIDRPHLRCALKSLIEADQTIRGAGDGVSVLGELRQAFGELKVSSASDAYLKNRYDAIECVKKAIDLLKRGEPTGGEVADLTQHAIEHLQFCLQTPV